jgi:predicted phosphodiesterase
MRIAAIYDIHGNLPALEAVLQEIAGAGVDQIVVGGDVVPGPMPREALALLLDLDVPAQFITGNGDREVLTQMQGGETSVPEQFRGVLRWSAEQLGAAYEPVLAGWPGTTRIHVSGVGDALFCHATPRDDNEIFTRLTPEERLLPLFDDVDAAVVVCGHTHMQFDRMIGQTRVVNAGSVGMPFGEAGAYWLLLGPDIQLRHTRYDLDEAAQRVRNTSYPQADDFAMNKILHPPAEATILERYARAEIR